MQWKGSSLRTASLLPHSSYPWPTQYQNTLCSCWCPSTGNENFRMLPLYPMNTGPFLTSRQRAFSCFSPPSQFQMETLFFFCLWMEILASLRVSVMVWQGFPCHKTVKIIPRIRHTEACNHGNWCLIRGPLIEVFYKSSMHVTHELLRHWKNIHFCELSSISIQVKYPSLVFINVSSKKVAIVDLGITWTTLLNSNDHFLVHENSGTHIPSLAGLMRVKKQKTAIHPF